MSRPRIMGAQCVLCKMKIEGERIVIKILTGKKTTVDGIEETIKYGIIDEGCRSAAEDAGMIERRVKNISAMRYWQCECGFMGKVAKPPEVACPVAGGGCGAIAWAEINVDEFGGPDMPNGKRSRAVIKSV